MSITADSPLLTTDPLRIETQAFAAHVNRLGGDRAAETRESPAPDVALLFMQCYVFCLRHHLQIFRGVVQAITVNVVNNLFARQLSPEHALSDDAMLCHVSTIHADIAITVPTVNEESLLLRAGSDFPNPPSLIAGMRTKSGRLALGEKLLSAVVTKPLGSRFPSLILPVYRRAGHRAKTLYRKSSWTTPKCLAAVFALFRRVGVPCLSRLRQPLAFARAELCLLRVAGLDKKRSAALMAGKRNRDRLRGHFRDLLHRFWGCHALGCSNSARAFRWENYTP